MTVVLAEKPSVARDIARSLGARKKRNGYLEGNGYQVTWAYGHLVTLQEPDDYDPALKRWRLDTLPIVPERFLLKVIDTTVARKQYRIVRDLFRTASMIICATDAGREGELIFRYIQQLSGCLQTPFKRLWLSSLTDDGIRDAFNQLADGHNYDALGDAARCRSEADWIVGLNSTRNFTVRYGGHGRLWSVGRVQTPVLTMIVQRDDEIERFTPEKYWELCTRYRDVRFKHIDINALESTAIRMATKAGMPVRFRTEEAAVPQLNQVRNHLFEIQSVKTKKQRQPPPLLFDLTDLQRTMNRRFHMTAAATLTAAQSLYEKKSITYPRTDSRFLPTDMKSRVAGILKRLHSTHSDAIDRLDLHALNLTPRIFNDNKVTDHHAIIPTGNEPAGLSNTEKRVYEAVVTRFIAAFYPACEKLATTVDGKAGTLLFRARGVQVRVPGWTQLYPTATTAKDDDDNHRDDTQPLPAFDVGETGAHAPYLHDGVTRPPAHYNESSLLSAMETCGRTVSDDELRDALKERGIGTPATRAQIIETLIQRQYIIRQKKNLVATDAGRYLVALITTESLKSAELTGEWESRLRQIERRELAAETFMTDIARYAQTIIQSSDVTAVDATRWGQCPRCNRDVIQGHRGYGCSGWKDGCEFVLWPTQDEFTLSSDDIRQLLQHGRIALPKTIRQGDAVLVVMRENGDLAQVTVPPSPERSASRQQHRKPKRTAPSGSNRSAKSTVTQAADADSQGKSDSVGGCPRCGKPVISSSRAFGCSAWRDGCKFAVWKQISGKRISEKTARRLLKTGKTAVLKGFKSKAGNSFSARLTLDDGQVKMVFPDTPSGE